MMERTRTGSLGVLRSLKAAEGFCRKNGVPLTSLYRKVEGKAEYIHVRALSGPLANVFGGLQNLRGIEGVGQVVCSQAYAITYIQDVCMKLSLNINFLNF